MLALDGTAFYGPFRFNDNGVNTKATLYVSQIIGGVPKVVYPNAVRQVPAVYPRSSAK